MILDIALKDLRVILRDRKALAVILLMPALIILILGTALGSMFSSSNAIDRYTIAVVDKDQAAMSGVLVNEIFKKQMSKLFETQVVADARADEMLKSKEVPVVVVIPEGFTQKVFQNQPVALEVKSQAGDLYKAGLVQSVVESFAQTHSNRIAGTEVVSQVLTSSMVFGGVEDGGDVQKTIQQRMMKMQEELGEKLSSSYVSFKEENREKRASLSALQYYSATMLVMFLLFGANLGTKMLLEERETKTLGRIMSANATKAKLMIGKCLGLFFICLMQALILVLFTYIAYGVSWGASMIGVLLTTVCAVFAAAGFGMLIAAIARTSKAADGMGVVFIQIMTLIGGGMIPAYVLPEAMKKLAMITPNWWATKSYHEMMMGTELISILPYCGILAGMGVLFLGVGISRFKVE